MFTTPQSTPTPVITPSTVALIDAFESAALGFHVHNNVAICQTAKSQLLTRLALLRQERGKLIDLAEEFYEYAAAKNDHATCDKIHASIHSLLVMK